MNLNWRASESRRDSRDSVVWELFSDRKLFDVTNKYGGRKAGHVIVHAFGEDNNKVACGFIHVLADGTKVWKAAFIMVWRKGKWYFETEPYGFGIDETFPYPYRRLFSDEEAAECMRWMLTNGASAAIVDEDKVPFLPGWPTI